VPGSCGHESKPPASQNAGIYCLAEVLIASQRRTVPHGAELINIEVLHRLDNIKMYNLFN
jgi:hypothetical protein